jgi:hypothetical protein
MTNERPTDDPHNWTADELRRERDRICELIEQADYIQWHASKSTSDNGDGESFTARLRAAAERRAWQAVPEHLRPGLARYLDEHIRPGSFLEAVLINDLRECFARGDIKSRAGLNDLVFYLYNHAPLGSWGSPQGYAHWLSPAIPIIELTETDAGGLADTELETDSEGQTGCPKCGGRHTLHIATAEPGKVVLKSDGATKQEHQIGFVYCGRVHLVVLSIDGKELRK